MPCFLYQLPFPILLNELHSPLLVNRHPPGVNKSSSEDPEPISRRSIESWISLSRGLDCRQTLALVVRSLCLSRRNLPRSVDEFLQGHVSVASLPVKVAVLVTGVFDVEGVALLCQLRRLFRIDSSLEGDHKTRKKFTSSFPISSSTMEYPRWAWSTRTSPYGHVSEIYTRSRTGHFAAPKP